MFYQQFPFLCVMQELGGSLGVLGRDVQGTVGKAWEAVGPRLAAPHFDGIAALRKATAFDVFSQQLPHLCVL